MTPIKASGSKRAKALDELQASLRMTRSCVRDCHEALDGVRDLLGENDSYLGNLQGSTFSPIVRAVGIAGGDEEGVALGIPEAASRLRLSLSSLGSRRLSLEEKEGSDVESPQVHNSSISSCSSHISSSKSCGRAIDFEDPGYVCVPVAYEELEKWAQQGLGRPGSFVGGQISFESDFTHKETLEEDASEQSKDFSEEPLLEELVLRVVHDRRRTGLEEKDFVPKQGDVVAGRYEVQEFLGEATFSKTFKCIDRKSEEQEDYPVCIKIIKSGKDFFDQALDEIKLLKFINNNNQDPDNNHVLNMLDYFYFKEHVFIVTELLRSNLYEVSLIDQGSYFTLENVRKITEQVLNALAFIHSLGILHCDLKPENILIQSFSNVRVKLIDFGSSCFVSDKLTTYIQSRSYRAPEVVLGILPFDHRIDIWSLGCVVAELLTGKVLFQSPTVQTMLARIVGTLGPIPEKMIRQGTNSSGLFVQAPSSRNDSSMISQSEIENVTEYTLFEVEEGGKASIILPRATPLTSMLDKSVSDFIRKLLTLDPRRRPSAAEALSELF